MKSRSILLIFLLFALCLLLAACAEGESQITHNPSITTENPEKTTTGSYLPHPGTPAYSTMRPQVTFPSDIQTTTAPVTTTAPDCAPHDYQLLRCEAATCTEEGRFIYSCAHCGDGYSTPIAALGHDYGLSAEAQPTCTDRGYRTYVCSGCSDGYTEYFGAPMGHDYGLGVEAQPTCTDRGYRTYVCSGCSGGYTEYFGAPMGHSYGITEERAPTCTEDGCTVYSCSHCGDSYNTPIASTGHSYGVTEERAPTCTSRGYRTYACAGCGHDYLEYFGEPNGHTLVATVTPPTCTEWGYTNYACTMCDYEYRGDYKQPGHAYDAVVTSPTCTADGYTVYTCHCGHSYVGDHKQALWHSYTETVVPPTCAQAGYTLYDCVRCDYSYRGNSVAPLPHEEILCYDTVGHWKGCKNCDYVEDKVWHYDLLCDCGYEIPVGGLLFGVYDDGDGEYVWVMQYRAPTDGSLLSLHIPATYCGLPVTFSPRHFGEMKGVRSVTVEKGVRLVDQGFWQCADLEEAVVHADVPEGMRIADGCTALKKLVITGACSGIAPQFDGMALDELHLPKGVKSITLGGNSVKELYFGGDVAEWLALDSHDFLRALNGHLYIGGKLLTDLVIPEGVKSIPKGAFYGLSDLASVSIPASVASIERSAFMNCTALASVTVAAAEIGQQAFRGCTALSSLTMREGIRAVRSEAFYGCSALKVAIFPEGLTTLSGEVFSECFDLYRVYIPGTLSELDGEGVGHYYIDIPLFDYNSTPIVLYGGEKGSASDALVQKLAWKYLFLPHEGIDSWISVGTAAGVYYGSPEDYFEADGIAYVRTAAGRAVAMRHLGDNTAVVLPETVTYRGEVLSVGGIGQYFLADSPATSLSIPRTVDRIIWMMGGDHLESITVDPENEHFVARDGVLFSADMKTLVLYPSAKQGASYAVPESVSSIEIGAIISKHLTYLYLPNASAMTYSSIGSRHGILVIGLADAEFPRDGMFTPAAWQHRTICILNVSASEALPERVALIGDFGYFLHGDTATLFTYRGTAREVVVPASITHGGKTYAVVGVRSGAFYKNATVERVILSEGILSVGTYGYNSDLASFDWYELGADVKENIASYYAFAECGSLREIILPDSLLYAYGLAGECPLLASIDFGNGLQYMTYGVVECPAITEIVLPSSVRYLDFQAIIDCASLSRLVIGTVDGKGPIGTATIGYYGVYNCPLTELVLGDCIGTIEDVGQLYNYGLRKLAIGRGLSEFNGSYWSYPLDELWVYGDPDERLGQVLDNTIAVESRHLYINGTLFAGTLTIDRAYEAFEMYGVCVTLSSNEDITRVIIEADGVYVGFPWCTAIREVVVRGEGVILAGFPYLEVLRIEGSVLEITANEYPALLRLEIPSLATWLAIDFGEWQTILFTEDTDIYLIGESEPCYSLVIPESVTKIPSHAFSGLDFTRYTVSLHAGVVKVGLRAFANASAVRLADTEGWYCSMDVDDPENARPATPDENGYDKVSGSVVGADWYYWYKRG